MMSDDAERLKRLMEEWGGGGNGSSAPAQSKTPLPSKPADAPRAKFKSEPVGLFPSGEILVLNEEDLVIYRRPVAGQADHMAYSLLADGSVKIEALNLAKMQVDSIGCLSADAFKQLQNTMRWSKKLVGAFCRKQEDAECLPDPGTDNEVAPPPPAAAPQQRTAPPPRKITTSELGGLQQESAGRADAEDDMREARSSASESMLGGAGVGAPKKIVRGQRFTINFGGKKWSGVFWGRDSHGQVVAHNTHRRWALMHMDLDPYKDSIIIEPEADKALVDEIGKDLQTGLPK